jgi:putative ABC transport system substrate-binding protein
MSGPSRRQFARGLAVASLGLAAGCVRLPWQAAPPRVPRVGWLEGAPPPAPGEYGRVDDFRDGLREFGYEDGKNIVVEVRYGEGRDDLLAERAAELVRLPVDVIVGVAGTGPVLAAREATQTIPIVMVGTTPDPLGMGLIDSYARPGGNVTGIATFPQARMAGKQLEYLQAVTPGLTRVARLRDRASGVLAPAVDAQDDAQSLGLQLQELEVRGPDDLEAALEAARREGAEALLIGGTPLLVAQAPRIAELAIQRRLTSIANWKVQAERGILLSYGAANPVEQHRRAAYYVDKLLKGARAETLPVEQPMRFDFVVNLRTAAALGLSIPPDVLLQATDVIQ